MFAGDRGDHVLNRAERVLVAGAGGFIGGHLVRYLAAQGFAEIRAVDILPVARWSQPAPAAECVELDLRDRAAAAAAVAGCAAVVNLAAETGGMGFVSQHGAAAMLSAAISAQLLEAARDAGVARYFFASCAGVYPAGLQQLADAPGVPEQDVYPAMPPDGSGWAALFSERLAQQFEADFGLTVRIARLHSVYGPHCAWEGGRERAPAALCRKIAEAILAGADEIEIWGDGNQTRSFLHVDDCVRGMLLILDGAVGQPCNLGSAELVSVNQLADVIEEIAGVRLKRRYQLAAPAGVRGRTSDNARLREALGWEPAITLREGMTGTYRWIASQVSARTLTGRRG
jgi:GDP-D-mannose 3', 5'-epimerase